MYRLVYVLLLPKFENKRKRESVKYKVSKCSEKRETCAYFYARTAGRPGGSVGDLES